MQYPIPKTVKEIQSFLGITGYYRKYIKDYAKLAKPLTSCLKKGSKIEHTNEFIECVKRFKHILSNNPLLQFPDFNQPFVLTTDASNFALGAILSQGPIGSDKPIAYASRTLGSAETNYSTIDKECLGIVWACKYFRPYLYGRKFVIVTDHKPLVHLFNIKDPTSKMIRWRLQLEEYDFTIHYKKGINNTNANALSRIRLNEMLASKSLKVPETIDSIISRSKQTIKNNDMSQMNMNKIVHSGCVDTITNTKNDRNNLVLSQYQDRMVTNVSDLATQYEIQKFTQIQIDNNLVNTKSFSIKETKTALNEFRNQLEVIIDQNHENIKETFFIKHEIFQRFIVKKSEYNSEDIMYVLNKYLRKKHITALFCNDEVFNQIDNVYTNNFSDSNLKIVRTKVQKLDIGDSLKQAEIIINEHKKAHRGINENYAKLKRKYYFPQMRELISNYVNNCEICKTNKYERNPTNVKFKISPTPQKPLEIFHVDTFCLRGKTFLTLIVKFSKYGMVEFLPDRKTTTVIKVLKNIFSREGIPKEIIFDNGTEYTSELMANFLKFYDTKMHITTAKSSTGNSPIERLHNTITEISRIIFYQNKSLEIQELLIDTILAYDNSVHSTTGLTPFELHRGNIEVKNIPKLNPVQPNKYLEEMRKKFETVNIAVAEETHKNKIRTVEKLNLKRDEPRTFEKNEIIFERNPTRDKLAPKYIKHKVTEDNDVTVKTNKRTVHKNKIKK